MSRCSQGEPASLHTVIRGDSARGHVFKSLRQGMNAGHTPCCFGIERSSPFFCRFASCCRRRPTGAEAACAGSRCPSRHPSASAIAYQHEILRARKLTLRLPQVRLALGPPSFSGFAARARVCIRAPPCERGGAKPAHWQAMGGYPNGNST